MKGTQHGQLISLVSSLVLFGVGGRAFPSVLIKTTRGSWRSVKDLSKLKMLGSVLRHELWLSV